jgi:predicted acyl esterase
VWGWGQVAGKPAYFSFGKVTTQFRDPEPEAMALWIVGPPVKQARPPEANGMKTEPDAIVPMRDGVELRTRVWLPGAASSAGDTDFAARLIDVQPDGRALNVTEGLVRARFRESIWEPPTLTEPGRIHECRIELLPVAMVFEPGHRVRLHLSSSSWPPWDRDQNTAHPIGMDAQVQVAEQTIYHDTDHPSHLMPPIAP